MVSYSIYLRHMRWEEFPNDFSCVYIYMFEYVYIYTTTQVFQLIFPLKLRCLDPSTFQALMYMRR